MDQRIFADLEFGNKKRKTHRELFLEWRDGLIAWQLLKVNMSTAQGRLVV